jgi:lipopolysaccharide export LptBFGC system permease protein LptF
MWTRLLSGQVGLAAPQWPDFMRISDRYIGKQVLTGTLYAVLVLGMVLVLGNLFKQIQPLLVDMKAPLELVIRIVINVLPLSLMYTIPWGFLSAVLMVFGRLSSSQEITSFRVAGLSLVRLAMPVFVIGAGLSALSLWLNVSVVPHSRATVFQLLYDQATRDPKSLLKPGVVDGKAFNQDSDSVPKLLIEGRSGDWVEGFHLYLSPKADSENRDTTYVHATRAAISVNESQRQLVLKLEDAYAEIRTEKGEVIPYGASVAEPVVFDLKDPKKPKPNSMSNEQIRHEIETNSSLSKSQKLKLHTEIVTRYSFSMACFAFAFIAVPLGLQARRRDSSMGLIYSLLIGAGYFLLTMMADQFKSDSGATAMLWAPNVACVFIGLFLFRRARFK